MKTWLKSSFAALVGALCLHGAGAQAAYPERPITITTPTAAGGGTDVVARQVGEMLSKLLEQPVVISNKPGAGGVIGTQGLLREKADGYSLLVTANSNQLIVPWLYASATFKPLEDFTPIANLGQMPFVLVVNPAFPAKDFSQFVSLVSQKPGYYQYASAGNGTLNHLIPEMLMQRLGAGASMEHVPYRGGAPAVTDVLGNQVPIYFGSLPSLLEHIRAGKLRALAVASAKRSPLLPDVPAISETLPGFESDLWVAMYAPKGVPQDVVNTLSQAIDKALRDPGLVKAFEGMGMQVLDEGPEALMRRQQAEYQAWGEVVRKTGARVD